MLTAILGVLAICYLIWMKKTAFKWPPGPRGVPFFGNLFQMDQVRPYMTLRKWGKIYGDVFRIQILGRNIIVVNSNEGAREVLVTKSTDFAGRSNNFRTDTLNDNKMSIVRSDYSEKWNRSKKQVMNAMRAYGDGMQRLEEITLDVLKDFTKDIESQKGQAMDYRFLIRTNVMQIVSCMVLGDRLQDPQTIIDSIDVQHKFINPTTLPVVLDMAPWLRHLPKGTIPRDTYTGLIELRQSLSSFFWKIIKNRKESAPWQEQPECYLDLMFLKQKEGSPDAYRDEDLWCVCRDILVPGTVTTSVAMYSLLSLCIKDLKLQDKIQNDIEKIIGTREPRLKDRSSLPYIEAVILETLRYTSQVMVLIPHKTTTDTSVGQFKIPKNTEVWVNSWSLHHDERYWEKPFEFIPERFLDETGNLIPPDHPNRKRFLVFGAGRRVCLGETLAKNRLFLFITHLLQKFRFLPENDGVVPETDVRKYIVFHDLHPPFYKMRAIPRNT